MIQHPFPPFYDADSTILILGSFPSVKSREERFFYGHKQNRFWKVTAAVFGCPEPKTREEKEAFLRGNHIALWDVIAACEISGSADSTIRSVRPNNLSEILQTAQIRRIFVNGRTAESNYNKYIKDTIGRGAVCLPSTSPANAAWTLPRLVEAWQVIREDEV